MQIKSLTESKIVRCTSATFGLDWIGRAQTADGSGVVREGIEIDAIGLAYHFQTKWPINRPATKARGSAIRTRSDQARTVAG
jgi:hypothetical protein